MHLEEFYNYKNQLMEDLLTDPEIVRLITDEPEMINDPKRLVYTQVFPYEFVPETLEKARVYICCDVDIQRAVNKTYLLPMLYIWIFAHKSKQRDPNGGVLIDKLASKIAERINGSRKYGLGELDLYSSRRFAPINDYLGKALVFDAKDFNRQANPKKPIPANRRG